MKNKKGILSKIFTLAAVFSMVVALAAPAAYADEGDDAAGAANDVAVDESASTGSLQADSSEDGTAQTVTAQSDTQYPSGDDATVAAQDDGGDSSGGTQDEGETILYGGETITQAGTYRLAGDATGIITINAGVDAAVEIVGNGVTFDSETDVVNGTPQKELFFVCSEGTDLTIRDVYISNTPGTDAGAVFDFTGTGNTITIEGTSVLYYYADPTASGNAAMHVGADTGLEINGAGTMCIYKGASDKGIGGQGQEADGQVTNTMTGQLFIRDIKQGALTASPASVAFSQASAEAEGDTPAVVEQRQLSVTLTDSDGAPVTSFTALYSSEDEDVATVDENGLVTAVGYGRTIITVTAAGYDAKAEVVVTVGTPVYFDTEQAGTKISVDDYVSSIKVYDRIDVEDASGRYVTYLPEGAFSYTATCDGYYASVCAFTVYSVNTETGTGQASEGDAERLVKFTTGWSSDTISAYGLDDLLDTSTGTFDISLEQFTPSTNVGAWDGTTIDVSFAQNYAERDEFHITNSQQWAGFAALVNGIYNKEITTIIDYDETGQIKEYTPEEYETYAGRKIIAAFSDSNGSSGKFGYNQVSSSAYYYNGISELDFMGKTVYLDADIDMGGWQKDDGTWTGARYMPIGGQYQMYFVKNGISDGFSHLGSSFNGNFNGQGHIISNIYCDKWSVTAYGDSSTIGLFGRVGVHDNDYSSWLKVGDNGGNYPPTEPTVEKVAITGYIYGRRSVGGIVGKTGHTSKNDLGDGSKGTIIRDCVNFAHVVGTDAKGTGGIVGAAWNGGIVKNCVNFGNVDHPSETGGKLDPTGGIVGYDENEIVNCYNLGTITVAGVTTNSYAEAIASQNGGGTVRNCYWLAGQANSGAYGFSDTSTVYKYDSISSFQTYAFITRISGVGRNFARAHSTDPIYALLSSTSYNGTSFELMPVPICFTDTEAAGVTLVSVTDMTDMSTFNTSYMQNQEFDKDSLDIEATYSDGSVYRLDPDTFTYSIDRPLQPGDTQMVVTVEYGGNTYTYTYNITVTITTPEEMKVSTDIPWDARGYYEGDSVNPEGLVLKITYDNDITVTVQYADGKFVNADNGNEEYDIDILTSYGTPGSLVKAMDGGTLGFSYTFNGVTVTAQTKNTIYVLDSDLKITPDSVNVYRINTADDLDRVAAGVNYGCIDAGSDFALEADIVANEGFTGIGGVMTSNLPFEGTFDGLGHTITVDIESTAGYTALFPIVENSTIRNVAVSGAITVGAQRTSGITYLGGIVGNCYNSVIEDCTNGAAVTNNSASTGASYVGGVAGYSYKSRITGCGNTGNVTNNGMATSYNFTGGIVGYLSTVTDGVLEDCTNSGNISGQVYVGGITAYIVTNTKVTSCTNTGAISAEYTGTGTVTTYAGGIVGYYKIGSSDEKGLITGCSNTGAVSNTAPSSGFAGGLVGYAYYVDITGCTNGNAGVMTVADCTAGGIVGLILNGAVTSSANSANMTATGSVATGGIAGQLGTGATISGCANRGAIKNTSQTAASTGGIAGKLSDESNKIEDSYNNGDITGYTSSSEGLGGIAGYMKTGSSISRAYNTGNVTNTKSGAAYAGALVGTSDGYNYILSVEDYAWLEGSASVAFGKEFTSGSATVEIQPAKTDAQMCSAAIYDILKDAYEPPCGVSGLKYPVLVVEGLGHTMSDEVSDVAAEEPTCTKPGVYYILCPVCDRPIITATKEAGSPLGHDFSGAYVSDENYHWHECLHEGCTATDEKKAHSYTTKASDKLAYAATCTEAAKYYAECDECGNVSDTVTVSVGSPLGHDFSGAYVSDENYHWHKCARAGCTATDEKKAHSYTTKASDKLASAATCTEAAKYYVECDECGNVSGTVTVSVGSPLGHDFSGAYVSDENYHWHKCARAGCTATDTKQAHVFTNYVSDNNATYEEDGTKTAKCDYCDVTNTITDEGSKKANTPVEKFVYRLYRLILDREPEDDGFKDNVGSLTSGRASGTDAAYGFVFSEEFKARNLCDGHFVEYLYRSFLDREADSAGKADWVSVLSSGTTREEVFNGFALSTEFGKFCKDAGIQQGSGIAIPQYGTMPTGPCTIENCGKTDGVIDFVYRMYDVCLSRVPDNGEQSGWVNNLRTHENTGTECADGFFNSTEYLGSNKTDEEYVKDLYSAYFGRTPLQSEVQAWVTALGREDRNQVRNGFSNSDEFEKLCKQYGITR